MEGGVQELLQVAYGQDLGRTGHDLAGHNAVEAADVARVVDEGHGSSLLYGELLPQGVEELRRAFFAGKDTTGPDLILELGMGTGKVALQLFLSRPSCDVYGVELAPSRWALADAALRRLAEAEPGRFACKTLSAERTKLVDRTTQRHCEIVCGSLLSTPEELLAAASAITMEVCLPAQARLQAASMLQHAATGCRAVCYAPLHGLVEGCRLAPVRFGDAPPEASAGDGAGGLRLAASWNPRGHGFAFYELAPSLDVARSLWLAAEGAAARVELDARGNPARGRRFKYTDDTLSDPVESYPWKPGDEVLVGYSWLPFPDLGDPSDTSLTGFDAVFWSKAQVIRVAENHFATVCYVDDGTTEDDVHPERIRSVGGGAKWEPRLIDWGED